MDRKKLPLLIFFVVSFLLLGILWLLRPRPQTTGLTSTQTPTVIELTQEKTAVLPPRATRTPRAAEPRATATQRIPATGGKTPTSVPPIQPTATPATATQEVEGFFISPEGSPDGDGSFENPWDLETALRHPDAVKPGDTLWLRGGTYGNNTRFTSYLNGEEEAPVVLRQYPGERATIDGGILAKGEWSWFWGFEITNSSNNRLANAEERPPGLYMKGRGQKAINLVVHDTGHPGIGFWSEVGDGGEVYGCILWGIGTQDTDRDNRTRGSAIYAQNQDGEHLVRDVISFRNFTTGMKAYAEEGYVNGFVFEGNISFENADRLIFVSGRDFPVKGLVLKNNYTYRSSFENDPPVRLGYSDVDQGDAVVQGNVFVNGNHEDGAFWIKRFQSLVFTDNQLISPNVLSTWIPAVNAGQIVWDRNQYFGGSGTPFRIDQAFYTFDLWKSQSSFDLNSSYSLSWPSNTQVYVRPNLYEPGRAHVAVYNWSLNEQVEIDLSEVLKPGDSYEILDVQNYFGDPVVSGVYDGKPVPVPMNLSQVSTLMGNSLAVQNTHTSPEFGAFVVQKATP